MYLVFSNYVAYLVLRPRTCIGGHCGMLFMPQMHCHSAIGKLNAVEWF